MENNGNKREFMRNDTNNKSCKSAVSRIIYMQVNGRGLINLILLDVQ